MTKDRPPADEVTGLEDFWCKYFELAVRMLLDLNIGRIMALPTENSLVNVLQVVLLYPPFPQILFLLSFFS